MPVLPHHQAKSWNWFAELKSHRPRTPADKCSCFVTAGMLRASTLAPSNAGKRSIKKRDRAAPKRNAPPVERFTRVPPPDDSKSNVKPSDPLSRDLSGADVVSLLQLQPHPEGGFYRRT
jgi:hypothetical protein